MRTRTNIERLQFIRAYYRIIGPEHNPKDLFEGLQDTFREIYGKSIYKNYLEFKASRIYYYNAGYITESGQYKVNRPGQDETCITCPNCASKLQFI